MLFEEIASLTDERTLYPDFGVRIPNQHFKKCDPIPVGRKTCIKPDPIPEPIYIGVDENGNDCVAFRE